MADASTTTQGDSSSAGITNEQLAQQVADLAGSVSSLSEKLQSISENVNKLSTTGDIDNDTAMVARSSVDPAAGQRRLETYAEMALANSVDFQRAVNSLTLRKISQDTDHHGAIPPIAPRSASGPGTTAS